MIDQVFLVHSVVNIAHQIHQRELVLVAIYHLVPPLIQFRYLRWFSHLDTKLLPFRLLDFWSESNCSPGDGRGALKERHLLQRPVWHMERVGLHVRHELLHALIGYKLVNENND